MIQSKPWSQNNNYLIYSDGRIFSIRSNKFLKLQESNNGYLRVELPIKPNHPKKFLVHRLVAETFIPCNDLSLQVNHKDENKHNNDVSNLEWVTPKENINYGTCKQKIAAKQYKRPVIMCDINSHEPIQEFESISQAYRFLNKTVGGHIRQVCLGQRAYAYGYW